MLASIPEFASGVFLVTIFVFSFGCCRAPARLTESGWSVASQLVLPVAVLVIYDFGYVARMIRTSMVEVMEQPYIRTAVLKGLIRGGSSCAMRCATRMIAPFTVLLLQLNYLVSGVVVMEIVFAYPGFGRMMLEASLFGDIALIEAATLVAVTVAMVTQLLGDLGYMLLDPQVRIR